MQQLDGLDIAGSQISVKIAPLTPAETQAAAAAAAGLDLDDAEGALSRYSVPVFYRAPSGDFRICQLLSSPFMGKASVSFSCTKLEQPAYCAGEHGGLKLTANARAALMQRLSGAAGSGANTTPLGAPGLGMPGQRSSPAVSVSCAAGSAASCPPSWPHTRQWLCLCCRCDGALAWASNGTGRHCGDVSGRPGAGHGAGHSGAFLAHPNPVPAFEKHV